MMKSKIALHWLGHCSFWLAAALVGTAAAAETVPAATEQDREWLLGAPPEPAHNRSTPERIELGRAGFVGTHEVDHHGHGHLVRGQIFTHRHVPQDEIRHLRGTEYRHVRDV